MVTNNNNYSLLFDFINELRDFKEDRLEYGSYCEEFDYYFTRNSMNLNEDDLDKINNRFTSNTKLVFSQLSEAVNCAVFALTNNGWHIDKLELIDSDLHFVEKGLDGKVSISLYEYGDDPRPLDRMSVPDVNVFCSLDKSLNSVISINDIVNSEQITNDFNVKVGSDFHFDDSELEFFVEQHTLKCVRGSKEKEDELGR